MLEEAARSSSPGKKCVGATLKIYFLNQIEWENNLDSMLAIIESVHTGVKGLVTCGDTGASLERAEVRLEGREKSIVTTLR